METVHIQPNSEKMLTPYILHIINITYCGTAFSHGNTLIYKISSPFRREHLTTNHYQNKQRLLVPGHLIYLMYVTSSSSYMFDCNGDVSAVNNNHQTVGLLSKQGVEDD